MDNTELFKWLAIVSPIFSGVIVGILGHLLSNRSKRIDILYQHKIPAFQEIHKILTDYKFELESNIYERQLINPFPKSDLISWDWTGVSLNKESHGINSKITDSIQFRVVTELAKEDVNIIYDDDYSGEIADIITIKQHSDKLKVNFYHLKFASDGKVSNQVSNFYEVCGQAQKSIHWKHKSGREFFEHLLRRQTKRKNGEECSRILKGTSEELEKLLSIAKIKIPMEFEIFIVQPSLSKANPSESILTLLGVTENYLMEYGGIKLNVITNR